MTLVRVTTHALLWLLWSGLSGCTCGGTAAECADGSQRYRIGERFAHADGCNQCTCLSTREISCTERSCVVPKPGDGGSVDEPDAGSEPDGELPRPASDCVDVDEDGFYTCLDENYPEWPQVVDCDDTRWFVQPGGYEFPDNGIDDNCDDLIDDQPACACNLTGSLSAADMSAAFDLCDDSVLNVTKSGNAAQFGVYEDYFGDVAPKEGACLLAISTGAAGSSDIISGGSYCSSCGEFALASDCAADPDPQGSTERVCDLATLSLRLRPPANAKGFEFSFMFLSAEWPEFLCLAYNDTFYTVVETDAVNGGEPANVSFDPQQREITVNVGFFEAPRNWSTPLSNTPFGASAFGTGCTSFAEPTCTLPEYCDEEGADLSYQGSGSGWLVTRAPFEPGEEEISVKFTIHDEADSIYDSLVLIDRFRWVPYRPPAGTSKPTE